VLELLLARMDADREERKTDKEERETIRKADQAKIAAGHKNCWQN
jgi:hypothetical protein